MRVGWFPNLVIYHAPCVDGFGARFIAESHARSSGYECEYLGFPASAPAPIEQCKGKRVLIVDIAWSRSALEQIHAIAAQLVVLDHHDTNRQELETLPYCRFDLTKSGIMLAWEHFYPDNIIPAWLYYLALRDLWKHKENVNAEAFCAAFENHNQTWEYFSQINNNPGRWTDMIREGQAILRYEAKLYEQLAKAAETRHWTIGGYTYRALVINQGHPFTSELGNQLCARDPDSIAFLWSKPKLTEPVSVSLRSAIGGPHVGNIAKTYGGGGHENAAGFRLKNSQDVESLFSQ
jgi:oligoribonuclease NrnB/cAMP/cGMP phosphodiesterase (DHH superfamily)